MNDALKPLKISRCVCSHCGAHATCMQGQASLGGTCTVCGSMELTVLERD